MQKTQSLHYNGIVTLIDATSVTMQNSFLIKNHTAANFDNYYQQMRRRRFGATIIAMTANQPMPNLDSPKEEEKNHERRGTLINAPPRVIELGKINGKMPAARDGHSAVILHE